MDKFKIIAFFLMLGVSMNFTPVTSTYGVYQNQFFRIPQVQQPYTPYAYYDTFRINTGFKSFPGAYYPSGYPSGYPSYQPQTPTVYSYYGTPVYDYRYPAVPFYIGGRPVYPLPPPQLPGPQDPSSKDKPKKDKKDKDKKNEKDDKEDEDPDKDAEKGDDDGIEKLDKKDEKKKNKSDKKPKKPEEDKKKPKDDKKEEDSTEPNEDSVTVDALE